MGKLVRVAIDGPSGAGKSTIAKKVAKALDLDYIDTGAMYRACGYKMSVNGIEAKSGDALQAMLDDTDIDFSNGSVYLDGQNIDKQIRTSEASMAASKYSGLHEVRAKLADLQRSMGKFRSVIMDGRDIGTNILTDAEYKFYLNASAEIRADKRYKELIEKRTGVSYNVSKILVRNERNIKRHNVPDTNIEIAWCPGAFEIPLIAKKLAMSGKYDAVICLGAVIRGATSHYDYVCSEVSKGIANVSLESGVPVMFGILTTDSIEQALERAGTKVGNKGFDCAENAIEMVNLINEIK